MRFRDHEFVRRRHPRAHRGRRRGAGPRPRVPPPRRAGPRRSCCCSTSRRSTSATPAEQARILLDELGRYRPELLERPRLVVGSKADVAFFELDDRPPESSDALEISAVTRQGLDELLGRLGTLIGEARGGRARARAVRACCRPAEEGFSVVRDDDGAWRVSGRSAERVVAMADLTNVEAMEYVQHRLRTMGVERALARAGAREGDIVRIGPVELDYVEGHRLIGRAVDRGRA